MTGWSTDDLEPAHDRDVDSILDLRNDAARWLLARGIDQWQVDQLPRSVVERRIADGTTSVLRAGAGSLVATVCVDFDDPHTWGEAGSDGTAGYIHTMVVHPDHIGAGLGRKIVTWAEDRIAETGRSVSRLDCAEHNADLRRWYRSAGYDEVGRRDYGEQWFSVTLFERNLSPPSI